MTNLRRLCFEDVIIGQELPTVEIAVTLASLVMYAGATWDFHRFHFDAEFVKERGIPAPFMDGQMMGALFARQLMQWGGPDAFVRRLKYRQRGMVYVGDRIVLNGTVSDTTVEAGRALALCKMNVTKQDGIEIVSNATAAVELTRRPSL